jgi:hypothetical protein
MTMTAQETADQKTTLRQIVLDIIFNPKKVNLQERPKNLKTLRYYMAQHLGQKDGLGNDKLNPPTKEIVEEIFWDLVVEREITIGSDTSVDSINDFRPHSQAKTKLMD